MPLFVEPNERLVQGSLTPAPEQKEETTKIMRPFSRLFKRPGSIGPKETYTPQPTSYNKPGFMFNTRESEHGHAAEQEDGFKKPEQLDKMAKSSAAGSSKWHPPGFANTSVKEPQVLRPKPQMSKDRV